MGMPDHSRPVDEVLRELRTKLLLAETMYVAAGVRRSPADARRRGARARCAHLGDDVRPCAAHPITPMLLTVTLAGCHVCDNRCHDRASGFYTERTGSRDNRSSSSKAIFTSSKCQSRGMVTYQVLTVEVQKNRLIFLTRARGACTVFSVLY
jgi:hypothetical protein